MADPPGQPPPADGEPPPTDPADGATEPLQPRPDAPARPPAPAASPPADRTASSPPTPPADGPPEALPPPSSVGLRRRVSYWFLAIVTLVGVALDLGTKEWAKAHFDSAVRGAPRELVLVDGFMQLIYAKNRGGAWGLLQNETDSLRRPFFLIVSVIAIVFIVSLYRKLAPGQTALKWGLPLVLGGALGNLIDRIRYGFVVDFIDVYVTWGGDTRHWPTFNVADIAICVGVGLMAVDMFTSRKPSRSGKASSAVSASGDPAAGPTGPEAATPQRPPGAPGTAPPPGSPEAASREGAFAALEPPGKSAAAVEPAAADDGPDPERREEPPAQPA